MVRSAKVAESVEVAVEYRVEKMRSGRRRNRGGKVEIIWAKIGCRTFVFRFESRWRNSNGAKE